MLSSDEESANDNGNQQEDEVNTDAHNEELEPNNQSRSKRLLPRMLGSRSRVCFQPQRESSD